MRDRSNAYLVSLSFRALRHSACAGMMKLERMGTINVRWLMEWRGSSDSAFTKYLHRGILINQAKSPTPNQTAEMDPSALDHPLRFHFVITTIAEIKLFNKVLNLAHNLRRESRVFPAKPEGNGLAA